MDTKNIAIGVLIVTTVLFGGLWLKQPTQIVVQPTLGGASGTDHTNAETFLDDLTYSRISHGGLVTLTATGSSTAITAANVCTGGIIAFPSGVLQSSTTLPTAATLTASCLTTVGDYVDVLFKNTSSTSFTVISGGTSSTLLVASGTAITATGIVPAGSQMPLRFIYDDSAAGTVKIYGIQY